MSSLNRYIVQIQGQDWSVQSLARRLNELGITLDEEYGLFAVDPKGEIRAGRALATDDAVRAAEQALPISFFPDMQISQAGKE